jgi:hypothetical protein
MGERWEADISASFVRRLGKSAVTGPQVVGRVTDLIRRLYARGEDLAEFFEREVAPLPPPHGNSVPAR